MSVTSDILKLKKEKNAVILAHYYVDEDVQEVADYVGDSFYLSKVATKVDQDIIVFAGVEFMGRVLRFLIRKRRCLCQSRGLIVQWHIWQLRKKFLRCVNSMMTLQLSVTSIQQQAKDLFRRLCDIIKCSKDSKEPS